MIRYLHQTLFLLVTILFCLSVQTSSAQEIIAEIGSKKVSWTDIENKQINDLRKELHQRMLERLKSLSLKELAKKYPEYKNKPELKIPEKELKRIYDLNNLSNRGTYKQFKPHLEAYYRKRIKSEFEDELFQQAVLSGKVKLFLEAPKNFLVTVKIGDAVLRGNKNADVMVMEFSDYQCPFCSRVQKTISELREDYQKQVAFAYKHLPLDFHPDAKNAANAVECAREQGRFEDYHVNLFKNHSQLKSADLKRYARNIRIRNLKQFNSCLDSGKYNERITSDLQEAKALAITGTPTFIIGRYDSAKKVLKGEVVSGALPKEQFMKLIDQFLKK